MTIEVILPGEGGRVLKSQGFDAKPCAGGGRHDDSGHLGGGVPAGGQGVRGGGSAPAEHHPQLPGSWPPGSGPHQGAGRQHRGEERGRYEGPAAKMRIDIPEFQAG